MAHQDEPFFFSPLQILYGRRLWILLAEVSDAFERGAVPDFLPFAESVLVLDLEHRQLDANDKASVEPTLGRALFAIKRSLLNEHQTNESFRGVIDRCFAVFPALHLVSLVDRSICSFEEAKIIAALSFEGF